MISTLGLPVELFYMDKMISFQGKWKLRCMGAQVRPFYMKRRIWLLYVQLFKAEERKMSLMRRISVQKKKYIVPLAADIVFC